jgi:hypothetical protein
MQFSYKPNAIQQIQPFNKRMKERKVVFLHHAGSGNTLNGNHAENPNSLMLVSVKAT